MSRPTRRAALVPAGLALALLTACGTTSPQADPATDPTSDPPGSTPQATSDPTAEPSDTPSLAGVCGEELVVQLPWWPGADYAFLFELIGPGGTVDADNGTYTGEITGTGVSLELRAGGPAAGFQPAQSLLYQDESIDLIVGSLPDQISSAADQPTTAVYSYYDVYPVIFLWGTDEWDFGSLEDVKASDATILAYGSGAYLAALQGNGVIDPQQVDPSFDGSPARFVAEEGRILQQDYITTAPYTFEHVVEQWGKPIRFISINSEFPVYGTTLQVRSGELEERAECLTELVPLIQRAAVDYALDPAATNEALVDLINQLPGVSSVVTPGSLQAANAAQLKYGLVANGTDGAHGSFDEARVAQNLALIAPAFRDQGIQVAEELDVADLVTNRFLDPAVSLPDDVPVPENTLPDHVPGL